MSKYNFLQMLKDGHQECSDFQCQTMSKGEYLAQDVFDFENYGGEDSELFSQRAVEVLQAINSGVAACHEYTSDPGRLLWYLIMVNMPFIKPKFSFGTTIRSGMWS